MFQLIGRRLGLLTSHAALLLLHHSFAIPKVLYILRTAPCFASDRLEKFDDVLRNVLSNILKCGPCSGVHLAASISSSAGGGNWYPMSSSAGTICLLILASVAGCSELIRQVLHSHLLDAADPNIEVALSLWSQDHDNPPPSSSRQRVWDDPKIEATYKTIFKNAPNQQACA